MKPIAVIILNWNGEKLLADYLHSVVDYTNNEIADIIVADNGSSDGSVNLVEHDFPGVKLIRLDKNYGYAGGYNKAISEAEGYEYIVLLNSDIEVKDDWLTPLYNYAKSHNDVGALQPKILSLRNNSYFEYAGASGGFLDRNGYPYCRGRIFSSVEQDNGQYDDITEIFWASGAALMVNRNLYLELGGLDERFFAHMEEIDLCWRMKLAGYRIMVIPESVVYHLGGASLDASNPRKTYLNFRNSLLMLRKNLPKKGGLRWRILFKRRLLDTLAIAMFVVKGKFRHATAIIKAHLYFAKNGHKFKSQSQISENLLKGTPNIITSYYFKRRHSFNEL